MAGCQNDPTNGFDLSNDAGYGRGGKDSILPDNQATNLREEIHNVHLNIDKSRATAQKYQSYRQMDKEIVLKQKRCSLINTYGLGYYYFIMK